MTTKGAGLHLTGHVTCCATQCLAWYLDQVAYLKDLVSVVTVVIFSFIYECSIRKCGIMSRRCVSFNTSYPVSYTY